MPIAIDESAAEPGAAGAGAADAVCLKIARCGGIGGVLRDAAAARAAGSAVYLASTFDGPLGIAAGLHAAAALRATGELLPCGLATLGAFGGAARGGRRKTRGTPRAGPARRCDPGPMSTEILRYAAFTDRPEGGNPAGVVLDASGLDDAAMQAIAADVGYSETAFVTAADGSDLGVRYFSPLAEVPFCGHATIATGVAWGERFGAGAAAAAPRRRASSRSTSPTAAVATLASVAPPSAELADADLDGAARRAGLDPTRPRPGAPAARRLRGRPPPRARRRHSRALAELDYDFDRLGALMAARDWTTIQLVHREGRDRFRSRNPFPPGGVVEDPATGAAAAAFGGYLRELGARHVPATVTIHQGDRARPAEPAHGRDPARATPASASIRRRAYRSVSRFAVGRTAGSDP